MSVELLADIAYSNSRTYQITIRLLSLLGLSGRSLDVLGISLARKAESVWVRTEMRIPVAPQQTQVKRARQSVVRSFHAGGFRRH